MQKPSKTQSTNRITSFQKSVTSQT